MEHQKELKEALKGLLALMALLVTELKDGAQLSDAGDILMKIKVNPELQMKLLEAYKGINQVPAELQHVSALDVISLLQAVAPEFMDVLHALKK